VENKFEAAYRQLNAQQKQAVDTIEGPLLVLAGPGTGKTQLLSLRVANILRLTDAQPSNILCLTFTDNAARNMRERLQTIIGQSAYHVSIQTFHSFGGEIINLYPDFFSDRRLIQQIDELGRYEILRSIFETLPHENPLSPQAGGEFIFIKDALALISWLKQNALKPTELRQLLKANQSFLSIIADSLAKTFEMTPSPKYLHLYTDLLKTIESNVSNNSLYGFSDYSELCARELRQAIESTSPSGRYAPNITAWRNAWCQKDESGNHIFKDEGRNLNKMMAVADVYELMSDQMASEGLYDFDDMIIEVVHAMEQNNELKFNLQERFQYILVDEFQDTNKAQLRMLSALGDNPIFEQRPNIMAVGDDDQAIYAFQGAQTSNMAEFIRLYRQPSKISLETNYRSNKRILEASDKVAGQISDRIENILTDTHKQLTPAVQHETDVLVHKTFKSELSQYAWIAEEVSNYMVKGIEPEQIAIIAPRHRYLERLVAYLGKKKIPVAYERRDNILDSPVILQLITMVRLLVAISENAQNEVDALISEVLAFEFWRIDSETLLSISLEAYDKHLHWLQVLNNFDNTLAKSITKWLTELASLIKIEPLEYVLDELMGGIDDSEHEFDDILLPDDQLKSVFISPMREFYFSKHKYEEQTDNYLSLLGQLSTLRQNLRQWKPMQALQAKDLLEFVDLHQAAGIKIVDSNPHTQTTNAVQVMTVYKAKGLEFEAVFVINLQDEVWGPTTRSRSSSISLPKNLPIAPARDSDNDKLRLFYVALTRAKHSLVLTSYTNTLENKLSPGLSFMINDDSQPIHPDFQANVAGETDITRDTEILTTDWAYRYKQIIADKPTLFEPILANYKLSVTHLNNFLDVTSGGPEYFLLHNLLRFPEAPTPSAAYGDAIHKTLQWTHLELRRIERLPNISEIQTYFIDIMSRKQLRAADHRRLEKRGQTALELYFKFRAESFLASDLLERGFNNEGVILEGANLSGKIDKIHFQSNMVVNVIDFKTGKPANSWQGKEDYEKVKLHKYRQQLLFYKILIEHSASFSGKITVAGAGLEFIESNEKGKLVKNLELTYEIDEIERFIRLIKAVWDHIIILSFPSIEKYAPNLKGINQFEEDLINGAI
jgi:DNA helicase-2/ATP-dependent DNA helicase PcrA